MITPEMSRILGKLVSTLNEYMRERGIDDDDENSELGARGRALYLHVMSIYSHHGAVIVENQAELDAEEAAIYDEITAFTDHELLDALLDMLRTRSDIPSEERQLLRLDA